MQDGANTQTSQPSQDHSASLTQCCTVWWQWQYAIVQARHANQAGILTLLERSLILLLPTPPPPPPRGSLDDWCKWALEVDRQTDELQWDTFLHVLDRCLLNVAVVHPFLSYIRDIKCITEADRLTIVTEVTYTPWANHEKCYFYSTFYPLYYCTANSRVH